MAPRYRARVPARGAGYLPWGSIDVPYPAHRGFTCLGSAVEMGAVQLTELRTGTLRNRDKCWCPRSDRIGVFLTRQVPAAGLVPLAGRARV